MTDPKSLFDIEKLLAEAIAEEERKHREAVLFLDIVQHFKNNPEVYNIGGNKQ